MDQTEWIRLRTELNHDWLKNVYLPALDAWLSVLDGEISDPDLEKSFLNVEFVGWGKKLEHFWRLSREFQDAMSPGNFVNHALLRKLPQKTHGWLVPLIETLWQTNQKIHEKQTSLDRALTKADSAYVDLRNSIANLSVEIVNPEECVKLKAGFYDFRNYCVDLGLAISALPKSRNLI